MAGITTISKKYSIYFIIFKLGANGTVIKNSATGLEVQYAQHMDSSTEKLGVFFHRYAIKHNNKFKQVGLQITPTVLVAV